jgi:PPOX class probable F420-dependent enzyme
MILNDAIRQALTSGRLAHLATINADGSPQMTLVWIGLDGDEIVCGHLGLHQKLKNIQRNERVALSMETGGKTGVLDNYLVIYGRARITEGGAPELLHRLAQIYVGPGTKFPADNAPPGYILHITIDDVRGVGPWKEE